MGVTREDSKYITLQAAMARLGLAAFSELDDTVAKILLELEPPVVMGAAFPTPDSKLYFGPSEVTAADGAGKTVPAINNLIPDRVASSIDFQGAHATTGAAFTVTFPTTTAGQFRRAAFTLMSDGSISVAFTNAAASLGAVDDPGFLFDASGIPLGWIDLEALGGTDYKTAGSVTSIIENSVSSVATIHRIAAGGGAGGGGGITNPLRITANSPADSKLTIKSSKLVLTDGAELVLPPVNGVVPSFVESTIDWLSLATTGGTIQTYDGSTFSAGVVPPAVSVGQFVRVGFTYLHQSSRVVLWFTSPQASVGALADGGTVIIPGGVPVGYIDLECVATNQFKTAGSSTSIIENAVGGISRIHRIVWDDSPRVLSGLTTIPNGATSVTVDLPFTVPAANYRVVPVFENTVDSNPQFQPITITSKTTTQFVAKWNATIDSANYKLSWMLYLT